MGFELVTSFIDHVYTHNSVTTSNYDAITNFRTLQTTRAHAKSSQSASTSRFMVTDFNTGPITASPPNYYT
jgi:hypothetical protein